MKVEPTAARALQPFLVEGEQLLWAGRPRQGLILRLFDLYLIPFSILWAGFAFHWNYEVWAGGASLDFKLFGLPFMLIGLYIVAGRFLHDALIRRRTSYGVTSRRILHLEARRSPRLQALEIDRMPSLEVRPRRDGCGTLSFDNRSPGAGWRYNFLEPWTPGMSSFPSFIGISDVKSVYDLVSRLARRP